jgi:hypothetical protein
MNFRGEPREASVNQVLQLPDIASFEVLKTSVAAFRSMGRRRA